MGATNLSVGLARLLNQEDIKIIRRHRVDMARLLRLGDIILHVGDQPSVLPIINHQLHGITELTRLQGTVQFP